MSTSNNQYVEVDGEENDSDSALGSDTQSITTSIESTIKNHRWEHGRRYHNYEDGAYPFPNDELEQDRLDLMSHMMSLILGGKLHLTPIKNPTRILDIGTGTADEYPSADVLGNDITPIQPRWVPPNVKFEIDNVENDWPNRRNYSFIHCRCMPCTISNWPRLVEQCYEHTETNGWAEFQDYDLVPYSEDGTLKPDNYITKMYDLLIQATKAGKMEPSPGPGLEKWLRNAGFKNVHHEVFKVPLGSWPKDPKLKKIGIINKAQFEDGLDGFLLRPYTKMLGWTNEEVQVFLAGVRKAVSDKDVHTLFDL
ncbi:S-adenosyl-L-methionine-dependent methyltransferase [Glonium stellatum]|uniref:S-adenosyl-L-methionine-dependent methyltransferase n=1 Tax=Glonium stellatum TaxID=574774 RepID=A0A8E2JRR0_9PEZI|nr:S-adenosyl-L-methionine-dependent methyltransferase [Glonium stellatum]